MADRKFNQKRDDANSARSKGQTTRSVGTTRGETTGGSRSNNRGGMSPIGTSQPPSMGLGRSAINNASFIDYRRTPGDTARTTLDLAKYARPTMAERNSKFHNELRAVDKQFDRNSYMDETRRILDPASVSFGNRPPVIKGSNNTTSPLSAKHNTAERGFSRLASDTRREHRQFQGQNPIEDEMTSANVDVAKGYAKQHQDLGRATSRDHMNTYMAKQTADMRSRVNQPGGEQIGNRNHVDSHQGGFSSGLNSMPQSGGDKYGPATASSVARDLGDYAIRPLGREFIDAGKSSVATAAKGATRQAVKGALRAGGLAVGSFLAGRAMEHGEPSVPQRSESQKMKDDAADMGPVKGRYLEKRTYQSAGGTRPQATKIVPYENQGKISKALGVSNVKAGENK